MLRRGQLGSTRALVWPAAALVLCAPTVHAEFTTNPPLTAALGEEYVYEAAADGAGQVEIMAPFGLPPWLTLESTGNGRAALRGTPLIADSTWTVYLRAVDARCRRLPFFCAAQSFTLAVGSAPNTDLLIESLTVAPAPALRDERVEWRAAAANDGPGDSAPSEITIEFGGTPLTFGDGVCVAEGGAERQRLRCPLEALPSGATTTVSVTATASDLGDVFAVARLDAATGSGTESESQTRSLNVGETISSDAAQFLPMSGIVAVAAGDLDGDGWDDVALGKSDGPSVALLLNTAAPAGLHADLADPASRRRGLSDAAITFGEPGAARDIALADLDNDGDLDLVTAGGAGRASRAYRNGGDGSAMDELAVLGDAQLDDRAVDVRDVDGDGFADVVVASGDAVRLFLNSAGAGFAAPPAVVTRAAAVDVALIDLLGSTLPDLVAAYAQGPVLVYENTGGGSFAAGTFVDSGPVSRIAAGDLNGDGATDLVLGRRLPGPDGLPANAVYLNDSLGGFVAGDGLGASPTIDVVVGDLDANGVRDVVAINATGAHQTFDGEGDGGFTQRGRLLARPDAAHAAIAAIGRQQGTDLVIVSADGLDVLFNDGAGNTGLGDTERPVVELVGAAEIVLEVEAAFEDPGAIATDAQDGSVAIVTDGSVDPNVVGSYTVTYTAYDSAGNAADPVTRAVLVNARSATGGGGGGLGVATLIGLVLSLLRLRACMRRRHAGGPDGAAATAQRRVPAALPPAALAALLAALLAVPWAEAAASELTYTYVDFGGLEADAGSAAGGSQPAGGSQTVLVTPDSGDGLLVAGSLGLGRRFFIAASYETVVVDVRAQIVSQSTTAVVSGNFDRVAAHTAVGYVQPIGERFDAYISVAYDRTQYDFGSFAGEDFDVDEAGAGAEIGFRWNPRPTFELFAAVHGSSVGEVDVTTKQVDTGSEARIGARWYLLEDLGIGVDYRRGADHIDRLALSLRFGFGELRAGR